jgi:hypothetical protein
MARRSFEMYEIRKIIVCLRSGETIRGIAQIKLANRKKIQAVRKTAVQQNWLDIKKEMPTDDVLATFFKQTPSAKVTQSSVLPYKNQIEDRIHGTTRAQPLTLFTQTEALLLQPLPDNPPECAVWEKVKLHNDCHVMYLQCRYSAPYQLVQEILWLRATETTVRIYEEQTLIAVHPRLIQPGTKHTIDAHLPPNANAYAMQDAPWCLEQSDSVGIHCKQVITILLTDKVTDYLRAAQGVLSLNKKYGSARLDAACHRALRKSITKI